MDDRRVAVLLIFGREALALVENERRLLACTFPLARFRYRRDEICSAATRCDPLCRLPGIVELPVARGVVVRRIQDWPFEEEVSHLAVPDHQVRPDVAYAAIQLILPFCRD